MEICHGIGVIENNVSAQKIDKSARDDIRPVLILEDLKLPGVLLFEGKLVGGDFFGGRKGLEKLPDFAEQFLCSLAAHGADLAYRKIGIRRSKARDVLLCTRAVALVEHDDLRQRREFFRVRGKFCVDLFKVVERIAPLRAGDVQDMADHARTLDMAQKVVPESRALRRALDEPRNIRNNKGIFIVLHNAQIG